MQEKFSIQQQRKYVEEKKSQIKICTEISYDRLIDELSYE